MFVCWMINISFLEEIAGEFRSKSHRTEHFVVLLMSFHFLSFRSISLWHTGKKKPIFTQSLAHGTDETHSESEGLIVGARWITSLAALRGTDLFASGECSLSVGGWNMFPNQPTAVLYHRS